MIGSRREDPADYAVNEVAAEIGARSTRATGGIAVAYADWRKRRWLFFQAEDGIRDIGVTGVQTCALPISHWSSLVRARTIFSSSSGVMGAHSRNRSSSPRTRTIGGTPAVRCRSEAERPTTSERDRKSVV